MIRRFVNTLVVVLAIAGMYFATRALTQSRGPDKPRFAAVFDNAFGITEGVDVRAAGVNVGSVKSLDVQRKTGRAIVRFELSRTDFGRFREDVFCRIEPQSLIGEYFVNCDPGTSRKMLPEGTQIPVERTGITIQPDLVNQTLRMPFRQRLGIILTELGAGFGGRSEDLQETVKRALPALRETDRVLALLARNRETIRALNVDADRALAPLADNRRDLSRFVDEARDTAVASASRREELAGTIRRFPRFLRELRPTLRDLGTAARAQTPALRNVRTSAQELTTLFERLGPFAEASTPALRSLGEAGVVGSRAARDSRETVRELRRLASTSSEPARNLRFILEHLDDRANAVEPNAESPGGKGFTGLEALLQYPYVQSQAINTFDSRGYLLKLNALINECTQYTNGETATTERDRTRRCTSRLGPGGPVDASAGGSARAAGDRDGGDRGRSGRRADDRRDDGDDRGGPRPGGPAAPGGGSGGGGPGGGPQGGAPAVPGLPELPQLPQVPQVPDAPSVPAPGRGPGGSAQDGLLDYLLGS
jgi:virulence factor Mce-like protein